MMNDIAISYLSHNVAQHIDMIEALRRGNAEVLGVTGTACLLQNRGNYALQLACDTAADGVKLLQNAPAFGLVVAHGDAAVCAVKTLRPDYDCRRPCHQGYYPSKERHAVPPTCTIAPYPIDRLDDVLAHYDNVRDPRYIIDRIEKGDLFAGYHEEQLCGFIGFHSDGSMGMLEVFPEFRRLHIGFALEQNLINAALDRGWTPYCHIYADNLPSIRLQEKLGLIVTSDCPVAWMHAPRE